MAEPSVNVMDSSVNSPSPCPQCGSKRLHKDGLRYSPEGPGVQRWLCRGCGYRFSEKPLKEKQKWAINTPNFSSSRRQIQIRVEETKNLTSATEIKTVAGDINRRKTFDTTRNIDVISEEARGLIIEFMAYLEREGFAAGNTYAQLLSHLVKDGANLLDPENVKTVVAKQKKRTKSPGATA